MIFSLNRLFLKLITPVTFSFGGGGGGDGGAEAREAKRVAKIDTGINAVNALFGTPERTAQYDSHRSNIFDLNKNELDEDYTDSRRNLKFSLAGRGLNNSSIDANRRAKLKGKYNDGMQTVNDRANTARNSLATSDERTRQGLVSSVQGGLDQTNAVSNALNNMKLNYDVAESNKVSKGFGGLFDEYDKMKQLNKYGRYFNSAGNDDDQFGQSYFTS